MRLSNLRPLVPILLLLTCCLHGCRSPQTLENTNVAVTEVKPQRFPFPTREPEVFQADMVLTAMGTETRYFVARKGDRRRLDFYEDGKLAATSLRTDAFYNIDHLSKTYLSVEFGSGEPPVANDIAKDYFRVGLPERYEDLDRKDGLARYKAKDGGIIVSIDEASGLMVRQEFFDGDGPPTMVYELRNLKLEVDDSVLQLPAGYRQIKK